MQLLIHQVQHKASIAEAITAGSPSDIGKHIASPAVLQGVDNPAAILERFVDHLITHILPHEVGVGYMGWADHVLMSLSVCVFVRACVWR